MVLYSLIIHAGERIQSGTRAEELLNNSAWSASESMSAGPLSIEIVFT